VDAPARVADELDQAPPDVQVDVLVRVLEAEAALRDLLLDPRQSPLNPRQRAGREKPGAPEASGVRAGPGDVLTGETPVERMRDGELRQRVAVGWRSPRPESPRASALHEK
jgi:hypothetical protein